MRAIDVLYYLALRDRVVSDYRGVGSMTVQSVEIRNEASPGG